MDNFVDSYYSVQRFQATYEGIVANIIDRNQWPEVDKGFHLHPPIGKKRGLGRQKKNRVKPAAERSGRQPDKPYVKDVVNMATGKVAGSVN
jgi:hypothetical protein